MRESEREAHRQTESSPGHVTAALLGRDKTTAYPEACFLGITKLSPKSAGDTQHHPSPSYIGFTHNLPTVRQDVPLSDQTASVKILSTERAWCVCVFMCVSVCLSVLVFTQAYVSYMADHGHAAMSCRSE